MKFSKYNLLVPNNDKYTIFNTLTVSCIEVKDDKVTVD